MRTITCFLICLLTLSKPQAQNAPLKLQNHHPATPGAFQFLKYTELPVSEYTGVPNISIPLYQIEEDGLAIPINLTYHGGGIRVSEEASWVGLGWNLNCYGSIVQEINDRDDYELGITRLRPDWNESPVPSLYTQKYTNNALGTLNPGWDNPDPIVPCKPLYSYRIYSAYPVNISYVGGMNVNKIAHYYLLPLNGNRDNQPSATDVVEHPLYDSEPDIFTANFLGHSIKFIRNSESNQIIVLNGAGYKVSRNQDVYKIIAPDGVEFYFELSSTTESYSSTVGGIGGNGSTPALPSSRIWVLTKIVTKNKQQIIFNYIQSGYVNNYPAYSEKWTVVTEESGSTFLTQDVLGYYQYPVSGLGKTYSYSWENRLYLNSIVFPKGMVEFVLSTRDDLQGGRKLDEIKVTGSSLVKTYQLAYEYFNSTHIGGYKYQPNNGGSYGNPDLRLKLLSLTDNSGAVHRFSYNTVSLPSKNSLAQDFWGFYNGQLTNASLIPNPARLNSVQLSGITGLSDNGNNNAANETYAKAGTLTSIQYPTGGVVSLEYELNEFDNYWVPDFSSTSNQISTGHGLRVHSIKYEAQENAHSKKTIYSYSGGKAMQPLQLSRRYSITNITNFPPSGGIKYQSILEINAKGFFSTNALSSGNYVGYSKVVKEEVDADGSALGRIETYFNNIPDDISSSASSSTMVNVSLPSKKHIYKSDNTLYPENGKPESIMVFNSQSKPVRKNEFSYSTLESDIYYGARLFSYANLYYDVAYAGNEYNPGYLPKTLCGYYPIYDVRSRLMYNTTTNYDDQGNSLTTQVYYIYDQYDQLTMEQVTTSDGRYEEIGYLRPQYDLDNPMSYSLYKANRLNETIKEERRNTGNAYGDIIVLSTVAREYSWLGSDKIVESKATLTNSLSNNIVNEVTYDLYDPANGRLLQMTNKGKVQSMHWGHKGNYLMAEAVNAKGNEIFFDSYEEYEGWEGVIAPQFGDAPIHEFDDSRSRAGKYAARIDKTTSGEYYSHSNKMLSVSLTEPTKFKLSGWVYSTGPSADIFLFMYRQNESPANGQYYSIVDNVSTSETGKWVYLEKEITVPKEIVKLNIRIDNNADNSGGGSVWFDDIRLHPSQAHMTTYTYEPLVGVSSMTDINNRTVYYEYDDASRLMHIRDKDRNILKKFCYNYQGQAEACQASTAPQWIATGQTRCETCELDANYTTSTLEQEEKDQNPVSATYGQIRWVDAGLSTSCVQDHWMDASPAEYRCRQDLSGNPTGEQEKRQVNLNPCSSQQERWVVIGVNCQSCPYKEPVWTPTGTAYCEQWSGGDNTGYRIIEEQNTEPCSAGYGTTRTTRLDDPIACPVPVYASLTYENTMHYTAYSTTDVTVWFYSDSEANAPTSVTGLEVHYASDDYCSGYGSYIYSCSGTSQVLERGAYIYYPSEDWYCPPEEICPLPDCYVDWYLESYTGYFIL